MNILCFESGGTKLVAALADARAQLRQRRIRYREPGQKAGETVSQLLESGAELAAGKSIAAVAFGFGGSVRRSDGRPLHCYHEEGWEAVDLPTELHRTFRAPVFIENDCNLAALAEAHAADYPGDGVLLYLTVGTGVGAGIVHAGSLLRLGDLGEAEIGHMVIEPGGEPCPCGNRGCLETLCSGPGLSRLADRLTGTPLGPRDLMSAFHRHEPEATLVVSTAAGYLARAIAATAAIVAPRSVVLGGGVMKDNAPFLALIETHCRPLLFPAFAAQGIDFQLSRLQEDVVCRGAARFALQNLAQLEVNLDF